MKNFTLPRLLHVMLRVNNLEKSIEFYTHLLGMKVLRKQDYPEGHFTLTFLGYEDESNSTVIELTHNWDDHQYELGDAFGHLALAINNLHEFCQYLKKHDVIITREPAPMRYDPTEVIAFILDPDGYSIELIEKP